MPYVQDQRTTYTLLILLVAAHISINYFAVRAVTFRSLNRQRTSIVWDAFRNQGSSKPLMTPQLVSREERLFADPCLLVRSEPGKARQARGRCDMGSALSTIIPCHPPRRSPWQALLGRHECPWWTGDSPGRWLPELLQLFEGDKYVIWFDAHAHRLSPPHLRVVLKTGHTARDHIKAWILATEVAASRIAKRELGSIDVQSLLGDVRSSKAVVDGLFPQFLEYVQNAKWDMDAAAGGLMTGLPVIIDVTTTSGLEDRKRR